MPMFALKTNDVTPVTRIFRELTPQLKDKTLEAALWQAAGVAQRALRQAAPVGTESTRKTRRVGSILVGRGRQLRRVKLLAKQSVPYDFGHLRDNIRRKRIRTSALPTVRVTAGRAFWGAFLEKGTRRMKPHPWFGRTLPGIQQQMVQTFAQALGKAVETAAIRLGADVSKANRTRLR